MSSVRKTSLAVGLTWSLAALTALAQDNARGGAQLAKPDAYARASTIIGMNAHSPQNENLGDISDLVIDCKAQRVVYAAMGVGGIDEMLEYTPKKASLKRNIDADEVGKTAVYLLSDLSSGVTGENLYVDSGFNTVGL